MTPSPPPSHPASIPAHLEWLREYYGLNEAHWADIGPTGHALYNLIRPIPDSKYEVDIQLMRLEAWVTDQDADLRPSGGGVEMNPDFQRGHVWTTKQQVAFCEAFIRGDAPTKLLFNCPNFTGGYSLKNGDLSPNVVQCIDGLQRWTALTKLARGEIQVFGGLVATDFANTPFDFRRLRAQVRIYGIARREDLLDLYLRLNTAGTPHSTEELTRVRGLLDAARQVGSATSAQAPVRRQLKP